MLRIPTAMTVAMTAGRFPVKAAKNTIAKAANAKTVSASTATTDKQVAADSAVEEEGVTALAMGKALTKATNAGAETAVASAAVGAAEVVTEAAVSEEVSVVTPIPKIQLLLLLLLLLLCQ